jgi:hypothetical protein
LAASGSNIELRFCRNAGHIYQAVCLTFSSGRSAMRNVALAVCLGIVVGCGNVAVAAEGGEAERITFDIPAQPLTTALETYSTVTGQEILYDAKLVVNRWSSAVKGLYTPPIALSILLGGTGLSPRSMVNNALMLQAVAPPVRQPLVTNTASSAAVTQYYGRIQSRLKAAFCADDGIQPGAYHVAVSFWIGATGIVSDVELLGTTGEPARDAMIDHTLRRLAIGASPPPGFAEPVTLVVAPWSTGMTPDCPVRPGEVPSSEAAP